MRVARDNVSSTPDLLRGDVGVTSRPDVGSIFWIAARLKRTAEAAFQMGPNLEPTVLYSTLTQCLLKTGNPAPV